MHILAIQFEAAGSHTPGLGGGFQYGRKIQAGGWG